MSIQTTRLVVCERHLGGGGEDTGKKMKGERKKRLKIKWSSLCHMHSRSGPCLDADKGKTAGISDVYA